MRLRRLGDIFLTNPRLHCRDAPLSGLADGRRSTSCPHTSLCKFTELGGNLLRDSRIANPGSRSDPSPRNQYPGGQRLKMDGAEFVLRAG